MADSCDLEIEENCGQPWTGPRAVHEDVPEQSHGVQEPSHEAPGGAVVTGSVSQPRDMLEDFNFNLR